jgi:hypothetical protein
MEERAGMLGQRRLERGEGMRVETLCTRGSPGQHGIELRGGGRDLDETLAVERNGDLGASRKLVEKLRVELPCRNAGIPYGGGGPADGRREQAGRCALGGAGTWLIDQGDTQASPRGRERRGEADDTTASDDEIGNAHRRGVMRGAALRADRATEPPGMQLAKDRHIRAISPGAAV